MTAAATRTRIMRGALECFVHDGYEQTTVARIRQRSGVSNGALFHHFRSKEAIADALYVEAIASFQQGLWELVRSRPRSLREAVRATVAHHLRWVEEHPDLARLVYARGHLDWDTPAGSELASLNRDLARAFGEWMQPLVRSGEMRASSMQMLTAIVSGPAHYLAGRWLAGQLGRPLQDCVDELADAAWAGLRGKPLPARELRRERPARSVLTLELLSGDGEVLARASAGAQLSYLEHGVAADASTDGERDHERKEQGP